MISTLQSLRFVFAIFIFLHHFQLFGSGGVSGVSFFMILSGFVMQEGYGDKTESEKFVYKKYMLKRIIRIYPLHLICLAVFVIWHIASLNLYLCATLIPNTFLMQSWIPIKTIYFSGNAVSWCLSDMLFFYITFPILSKIMQKNIYKTISYISTTIAIYIMVCNFIPEKYLHPILYINPLVRLLDFAIGILLHIIIRKLTYNELGNRIKNISISLKTMIEIFAFLPLVLALFTCNYVPKAFQYASLFWIPSCVIIAVFALFNNEGGGLSYILKRKLIVLAGAFSFTFYMIHQMLIIFTNSLLENFGITLSLWEKLPLVLTCTIALSYIIYRFIEIPTTKILKEYIR